MNTVKRPYKILLSLAWWAFASFLFFLPGSALPHSNVIIGLELDKWVHVGIFMILLCLWSWSFEIRERKFYWVLLSIAVVYGLLVEIIQQEFISNRSFDARDLVADFTGSVAGLGIWRIYCLYKKR